MNTDSPDMTAAPEANSNRGSKIMKRGQLGMLYSLPIVMSAIAYGGGIATYSKIAEPVVHEVVTTEANGPVLFERHCANCHGINGTGKGIAELDPPARYFGMEKFKFVSTDNGMPTDDDLRRVIKLGISGSAMPHFNYLSEPEVTALVGHVRQLTKAGVYARIYEKQVKDEGEADPADVTVKALTLSAPGTELKVPDSFPAVDAAGLANGKKHFITICASCHGQEGKGDGPQVKDMKNDNGTPNRPRDLTTGIFKAGRDHEQLYKRIRLGIPGTPMPATTASTLPDKDANDLIAYIRSLSESTANLPRGDLVRAGAK